MLVEQVIEKVGLRKHQAIQQSESVGSAIIKMSKSGSGALLVFSEKSLVGIFSERDFIRRIVLSSLDPHKTRVRDVMTRDVIFAEPNMSLETCLGLMGCKSVRHLPVLENGRCQGLLSMIEIIDELLKDREFMIDQLNNYISGSQQSLRIYEPVNLSDAS